jgi:hypothetical protein
LLLSDRIPARVYIHAETVFKLKETAAQDTMQNAVNAFKHHLGDDVQIIHGDPSMDSAICMDYTRGYIDLCVAHNRVWCLLNTGASMEITMDGSSACLNPTIRSTGAFESCSGFQDAIGKLLICAGWCTKPTVA